MYHVYILRYTYKTKLLAYKKDGRTVGVFGTEIQIKYDWFNIEIHDQQNSFNLIENSTNKQKLEIPPLSN